MTRWDEIAAGYELVALTFPCDGRVRIGDPPAVGRPEIRKPAHIARSLVADTDLLGQVEAEDGTVTPAPEGVLCHGTLVRNDPNRTFTLCRDRATGWIVGHDPEVVVQAAAPG